MRRRRSRSDFAGGALGDRCHRRGSGSDCGERARRCSSCLLTAVVLIFASAGAIAETATIAVASNFLPPLRELEAGFESGSDHRLTLVAGSTGQLYAQIVNGAPFDVLLAADAERPALLAARGHGDAASIFTYAIGRLALWSAQSGRVDPATLERLGSVDFRWLAIANPELAPYGAAAEQALRRLGLWESLLPRIVRGQNVGQAFALAQSGSAELGLVALSQAVAYTGAASYAAVPDALYEPIRQDAIVLERGAHNPAVLEFIAFLRGANAVELIERFGYRAVNEAVD